MAKKTAAKQSKKAKAKAKPKKTVLKPDKQVWWIATFVLLGLAVTAFVLGYKNILSSLIAWPACGFFGLAGLMASLVLLPNAVYLTLHDTGFTAKGLFNLFSCRWDEIECFGIVEYDSMHSRVGVRFIVPFEPGKNPAADLWNRPLGNYDGIMPDLYGKETAVLAGLLEKWRRIRMKALLEAEEAKALQAESKSEPEIAPTTTPKSGGRNPKNA